MRRLLWLIVILAVIWCTWWMVASAGLQRVVTDWFEDQRNIGWQADVAEVSQHGFPFTLHARVLDISLADPSTGIEVVAPQLDLIAAAYWPGYLTVRLSDAPIEIATPTGRFTLQTKAAQADLRVYPGVALQVQSIGLVSDAWQVRAADGDIVSADDLVVSMTQDEVSSETFQFDVNATKLTPGILVRTLFALPIEWPMAFDAFTADLSVTFDTPWDRKALIENRPQPRAIFIRNADASWGVARMSATGELTIDQSGIPTGDISIVVANWREIIKVAEASGALPSAQRGQVEIMLSAVANLGGGRDDLDLNLSFQNGDMSLGPIRLGPVPRLILD